MWTRVGEVLHDRLAPKIDARKNAHVTGLLETFERDIAPLVAPIAQSLLDDESTPAELRPMLETLTGPTHFSESIIIGIALGSILSPVLAAAIAPQVQGVENTAWPKSPNRPLPPELLAASVLKNVLTEDQAKGTAAVSGIDNGAFHTMVETAGQSIGVAEALLLLRRGQITDAQFTQVLQYSNVNKAFYDMARALRYAPPSVGEVITGALKGHLTAADAQARLAVAGVDPSNYAWLLASAGRPPGVEMVIQLWNRQLATEADVDRTIRQSDINPDFADLVKATRWYQIPPRSIVPMLRAGGITEARARTLLSEHGVRTEDQDAFIAEAKHTTTSTAKELTQAQITRMYGDRFLTRAAANARLVTIGYPADQITLLLDYADTARTEKLTNALITKVGTLYVGHKLTKADATTPLTNAGIPTAAQHDLFAVWDIERTANLHVPTPAGVIGAMRRGIITPAATHRRLNALGISDDDIAIFVGDGWPPTAPQDAHAAVTAVLSDSTAPFVSGAGGAASTKHLTESQIVKVYKAGQITRAVALTQLEGIGYTAADANQLLNLADGTGGKTLTEAQIVQLYKAGQLTRAAALAALEGIGYTAAAAGQLLTLADAQTAP